MPGPVKAGDLDAALAATDSNDEDVTRLTTERDNLKLELQKKEAELEAALSNGGKRTSTRTSSRVTEEDVAIPNVRKQSTLQGVKGAVLDTLTGSDSHVVITPDDISNLPQLNSKNEHQFAWIQYLVWRRVMMKVAVVVSFLIMIFAVLDAQNKYRTNQNIVSRCKSSLETGVPHPTNLSRTWQAKDQYYEITVPQDQVEGPAYNPNPTPGRCYDLANSDAAGNPTELYDFHNYKLGCNPGVVSDGYDEYGDPKWNQSNTGIPTRYWDGAPAPHYTHELVVPPGGAKIYDGRGRRVSAHDVNLYQKCAWSPYVPWTECDASKEQTRQRKKCLCAFSATAFDGYEFVDMQNNRLVDLTKLRNGSKFADRADGTGLLRSLAPQLESPERCQAPNATITEEHGHISEGHACTVTLESYTYDAQTKKFTRIPGTQRNASGMFYDFRNMLMCVVSEGNERYKAPNSLFPPIERRPCCTQSEFLFTYASWTPRKEVFWWIQTAVNGVIAVMNLIMSIAALRTWSRWHKSARFVLIAFAFPFVLKFVIFAVPEFAAVDVKPQLMADNFTNYEIRRRGFSSYGELETSGTRIATDTIREILSLQVEKQSPDKVCPTLYPKSVYEYRDCVEKAEINPNKTEQPFGCPEYLDMPPAAKTTLYAQLATCDPWGMFQFYKSGENLRTFNNGTFDNIPELGVCSNLKSNWSAAEQYGMAAGYELGSAEEQGRSFEKGLTEKYSVAIKEEDEGAIEDFGGLPPQVQSFSDEGIETMQGELKKYPKGFGMLTVPVKPDNVTLNQECALWLSILPAAMDVAIPTFFAEAQQEMRQFYELARSKTKDLAALSVRLKATVTTLSALFPITFALLPGIAKGAKQVKRVLPASALVTCILAVVPVLQIPLMAVIMGIVTQVTGYWHFYVGVIALMLGLITPMPGAFAAVGAHHTNTQYLAQQKVKFLGVPMAVHKVILLLGALAAFIFGFFDSGVEEQLGLEDVLGDFSGKFFSVFGPVLNFFKGRTITTVMSSDCILRMMIGLQREDVIYEDSLVPKFRARMVAGTIAGLTADRARELMKEFDEDGDGEFDEQEIKGMIKTLAHENPKYQFDEDGKVRHHEDKAASAKAIKEHEGAVAAANVVAVGAAATVVALSVDV